MNTQQDGRHFHFGDFEIDLIVHGFPGKSVCHGPLGFSTIALVRHRERLALVDVGGFGQRLLLQDRLSERHLTPADVTDVLLTHSHYDHAINWLLFPNAKIVISQDELKWALEQPWGETYVPELYVRELRQSPRLREVATGDNVFPGITAHMTPGHTPGHVSVEIASRGERAVITGDLFHHPLGFAHPDWEDVADVDGARAHQSRLAFLQRYGDGPVLVLGTHFATPTAGRVVSSGAAWRFEV